MDLGCIDMGCVEKPMKETCVEKDNSSPKESVTSASKLGKNSKGKDAVRSSLNALNKLTSQISKPPRRKTSPLNWFPRKKVEPYLKRKIKMLQEVDGMCSTLDETLGDSNPHYCRVLREKMAIREAAEKAIEARKSAMVEASWCRILQAARIESKEAEAQLSKAEVSAAEALEAARAVGVIMTDIPESTQSSNYKIETVSVKGGSDSNHTFKATFETAFEVDKQVAAAVKAAFIKLANCPSISRDEFRELLRKISENPDTDDNYNALSSECESDNMAEMENVSCSDEEELGGVKLRKEDKREETDNRFNMDNIVDMMLDRLRCLKEDELASLATIVATSGLNAALSKTVDNVESHCLKASSRMSVGGREGSTEVKLPSLDKFLVKRLTRLEREVLEAKKAARKNETSDGGNIDSKTSSRTELELEEGVDDLGSVLVKHSSKLEKEVAEARTNGAKKSSQIDNKKPEKDVEAIPSLDKFLVKRLTRLEREVQEAKEGKRAEIINEGDHLTGKENTDTNEIKNRRNTSSDSKRNGYGDYESLDKVLVKHVSRLEKEKSEFSETRMKPKQKGGEPETSEGGLDQVLVKHKLRLEREKTAAVDDHQQEDGNRHSVSRRQARERELQDAWGGLSLGNSIRPHVSRLQRDKAAWMKAEEEERKREIEEAV